MTKFKVDFGFLLNNNNNNNKFIVEDLISLMTFFSIKARLEKKKRKNSSFIGEYNEAFTTSGSIS